MLFDYLFAIAFLLFSASFFYKAFAFYKQTFSWKKNELYIGGFFLVVAIAFVALQPIGQILNPKEIFSGESIVLTPTKVPKTETEFVFIASPTTDITECGTNLYCFNVNVISETKGKLEQKQGLLVKTNGVIILEEEMEIRADKNDSAVFADAKNIFSTMPMGEIQ